MSDWISVEDVSIAPEINKTHLACYVNQGKQYITTAVITAVKRHIGESSPIDWRWYVQPARGHDITRLITHWQPLPEPPKEQDSDASSAGLAKGNSLDALDGEK